MSGELPGRASAARGPAETLERLAQQIRRQFGVEVCSIYLVQSDRGTLTLAATVGLDPGSVGRVTMGLHEGLTGLAAQELSPVAVEDARVHPRFKFFAEAGEDDYRSFLGVPILDRGVVQGVLVVQTREPRKFSQEETERLSDAARHTAPIVSKARARGHFIAPSYDRIWELARNLWWSWDSAACGLFRDLAPERWQEVGHNPIALLAELSMEQFEQRSRRHVLYSTLNYTYRRLQEYLDSRETWGARHAGVLHSRPVAYFSAEFGLHESLPIYSGGLGILAGDHLKSASDLGVPLVGLGLFYGQGYFHQKLDLEGWQQQDYVDVSRRTLPLELALDRDRQPITVRCETRTGAIEARVWRLWVGRNPLYLLDSDVEGNAPEDRELTARLYGGGERVRIRQELLLGVGGVRTLRALGIHVGALHLNEGHSAFACLEMVRQRMVDEGIGFDEALRAVERQTVFTTHTPVAAGHDRFSAELVEEHLGPICDELRIPLEALLKLGRIRPDDESELFCMTALALRGATRTNAVSSLHGTVSRAMWRELYRVQDDEEVPIGHITNGIHVPSWIAPQMRELFARRLGPDWISHSSDPDLWSAISELEPGELWETHQALKAQLLDFVRERAVQQADRRGEPAEVLESLSRALSLDALTLGFARRFATYKRANLLMHDVEQLVTLINHAQHPVQLIFAGKAHPRDEPGKQMLREISQLARDPRFAGKLVFLEDYDIDMGRHLVQGVDVWLNNPRRPFEASGTSGMKGVLNGVLHLSVLDGWWAEAYDGRNGFAIGRGQAHTSLEVHDRRDAAALYRALRDEVVPLYYDRDLDGVPHAWTERMKTAIQTLGWRFNADRMVKDYTLGSYVPAAGGTSSQIRTR